MSNTSIRWMFNFQKWNPTPAEILLATTCLQQEEKERLGKLVFKADFKSSLIGLLMMRKFVHDITQEPYNEIKFERNEKLKPMYPSTKYSLNFNISHHGDYTVLVGEEGNTKLGVDVMSFDFRPDRSTSEYFRIMARTFSRSEWDIIKGAGCEKKQLDMFHRHWCLKESYVKAIGVGITVNLQSIVFKINTLRLSSDVIVDDSEIFVDGKKLDWEFHEMLLNEEHCVAVAFSSKNNRRIKFQELSFPDLVAKAIPLLANDQIYCDKYYMKLEKS